MACSAQTYRKPSFVVKTYRKQSFVVKLETERDVSVANLSAEQIKAKCSFTVVLSGGTLINTLRVRPIILHEYCPDGHMASLYPGKPERLEREKWVTCNYDSPVSAALTFPIIKSASYIAMVVTDKDLAVAASETLTGITRCNEQLISGMELQEEAEGEITWFLDKDAASELN